MFFIFSKALQFIIHPVNWVIGLGLYGLFSKDELRRKRAFQSSLLLFIILTNPAIHDLVFGYWETQPIPFAELDNHDVAIVLGGYSNPKANPRDRLHLGGSPNRLVHSVQLYKLGKVKKLILTGGSATVIGEKVSEATTVARYLSDLGIPEQDVLVESISRNTHENALQTKALLEKLNMKDARCLLVTSAFHQPRATRCFQKVGVDVTPIATDAFVPNRKDNPLKYLTPSSKVFYHWEALVKEWVGMAVYKVKGYI